MVMVRNESGVRKGHLKMRSIAISQRLRGGGVRGQGHVDDGIAKWTLTLTSLLPSRTKWQNPGSEQKLPVGISRGADTLLPNRRKPGMPIKVTVSNGDWALVEAVRSTHRNTGAHFLVPSHEALGNRVASGALHTRCQQHGHISDATLES